MALLSQHLQRFLLNEHNSLSSSFKSTTNRSSSGGGSGTSLLTVNARIRSCSAIAIDAQSSSLTDIARIRWGSTSLQGARDEMEDGVVVRSDGLDGFSFAAVFDGHAGFSSVKFLRDELYKECCGALQGGLLLGEKNFKVIREALQEAFLKVDNKLLNWLETTGEGNESGATATVLFIGNDMLFISHVGDSSVLPVDMQVLSRSGKAETLTNPHRPYGNSKVSLQEIKRIREAGGWIVNGRICGDIAVSRAFGDMRFKTKKNEMLKKGVEEGRWSKKFVSRVQFSGDLVTASPDIFQVALEKDAEFVLLASDGLWDYINRLSLGSVLFLFQLACEALAQAALDRYSQDNISIVIADLGYVTVSMRLFCFHCKKVEN
ncbi:hypothetical protein FEM48_Zijuj03G0180100 [Ziziphus jujuba var. spinosa]|uniref:protein-serine/threonine phosphatase n=1 Tax=Ziziphus jujuba var. spinosa TaxID=714518 RepID=A0A978VRT2_ZIZJJ|nr:hypothetical protein FEM48_Zijuj03G0180100 [Ziziphus jujuba var. spinosa]